MRVRRKQQLRDGRAAEDGADNAPRALRGEVEAEAEAVGGKTKSGKYIRAINSVHKYLNSGSCLPGAKSHIVTAKIKSRESNGRT